MRVRLAQQILGLAILSCVAVAIAAPSSRATVSAREVAWAGLGDGVLVSVWADGSVGVWDADTGRLETLFSLAHFSYRDMDFAVSGGPSPVLAVLLATGNDTQCTFYDLRTGKPQGQLTLDRSAPVDTVGFSNSGRSFFCGSNAWNAIFRVSMQTRQASRFAHEGSKLLSPQYAGDGKSYVNFTSDGEVIAHNWKGRTAWSLKQFYPLSGAEMSPAPVLLLTDYVGRGLHVIRLADGLDLWHDSWIDAKHILAASADGHRLALWRGGNLELIGIPENTRHRVGAVDKRTEVSFSADSKRLLYMPSLEIAGEDSRRMNVLRRDSNVACIVNAHTGQVIRRITLRKGEPTGPDARVEAKPAAPVHADRPDRPARAVPVPPLTLVKAEKPSPRLRDRRVEPAVAPVRAKAVKPAPSPEAITPPKATPPTATPPAGETLD